MMIKKTRREIGFHGGFSIVYQTLQATPLDGRRQATPLLYNFATGGVAARTGVGIVVIVVGVAIGSVTVAVVVIVGSCSSTKQDVARRQYSNCAEEQYRCKNPFFHDSYRFILV
jgi:hypothetical protein